MTLNEAIAAILADEGWLGEFRVESILRAYGDERERAGLERAAQASKERA